MTFRLAFLAGPLLVAAACSSTQAAPSASAQAVVDSVAARHPDCVRLTVHGVPPEGGVSCAIASTAAEKRGKPSDKEDIDAMRTGETIVLDEAGALDVTVPILQREGKWTHACGVTLKAATGVNRAQVIVRAKDIAREVERGMATEAR
jgi:hypothetical protein